MPRFLARQVICSLTQNVVVKRLSQGFRLCTEQMASSGSIDKEPDHLMHSMHLGKQY